MLDKWIGRLLEDLKDIDYRTFVERAQEIVTSFDEIEILESTKPKVGIVGEIWSSTIQSPIMN